MSTFGLIEYSDASPAIKPLHDHVMARCKTDYIIKSGFPIWISDPRILRFSYPQHNNWPLEQAPARSAGWVLWNAGPRRFN